jgi:hypothetical protein
MIYGSAVQSFGMRPPPRHAAGVTAEPLCFVRRRAERLAALSAEIGASRFAGHSAAETVPPAERLDGIFRNAEGFGDFVITHSVPAKAGDFTFLQIGHL